MPPPSPAWPSARPRPKQTPKPKLDDAPHKSLQVTQLQLLISNLENQPPTRDPKGGCFCLARSHPLSPYIPLCKSCGLILCSFNKPYHLCPSSHCPSPNLLPSSEHRTHLLTILRHQLSTEIQKEEHLKSKLAEEKKKQAGAFPSLQSSTTSASPNPKSTPQPTHKVLSITSSSQSKTNKKKRVITISSPSSSVPPSRTESPSLPIDNDPRVPEPPNSVIHAHPPSSQILKSRPWRNFTLGLDDGNDDRSVDIRYIPLSP